MKYLLLLLLLALNVHAKTIRIAVVDSGLDLNDPRFKKYLCKDASHTDVIGEGIDDKLSHGTHIAGTIIKNAGKANFCLIIIKYYTMYYGTPIIKPIEGFKAAIAQRPDMINFSSTGFKYLEEEYNLIKDHRKILFVVSAGNDNINIDNEKVYPARYELPNIMTVSALKANGKDKLDLASYGKKVNIWEVGEDIEAPMPSYMCKNKSKPCTGKLSGSSMATAIVTGQLANVIK